MSPLLQLYKFKSNLLQSIYSYSFSLGGACVRQRIQTSIIFCNIFTLSERFLCKLRYQMPLCISSSPKNSE